LVNRLGERLRLVPGVMTVSHARPPGQSWGREIIQNPTSVVSMFAEPSAVGTDYLKVLGLRTVAGREFAESDGVASSRMGLMNQSLTDALWPGESPIGKTIIVGRSRQPIEIAGVTPDAFFSGFRGGTRSNFIFYFAKQAPSPPGEMTFLLRYRGSLQALAPAIEPAVHEVDSSLPLISLRTMQDQLERDESLWLVRTLTILLTAFALGSLMIATVGQYAVVAFSMRRRVRDFGVRMALGASPNQIVRSVLSEGLRLTLVGLVLGLSLSVAIGTCLRQLLYEVTPTDARTYGAVFALLTIASLVACYLPARRASHIDPMHALRHE
jgi:putative ABC transport system permease protein